MHRELFTCPRSSRGSGHRPYLEVRVGAQRLDLQEVKRAFDLLVDKEQR